jgi:hypothetical protein
MFDEILIANRGAERPQAASYTRPPRVARGDFTAGHEACSTRS